MTEPKVNGTKRTANVQKLKKTVPPKKTNVQINLTTNPAKNTVTKVTSISDISKGIIDSITKVLELKSYKKDLAKDEQTIIQKSQEHLLGLVKYYEGDPNNYYEAKIGSYNDKYNKKTKGFGCTKPLVSIKTQEGAYEQLKRDLIDANNAAKNKIDNRLGKGTYKKLPLSVREALIDLSFNKGPGKVVKPGLLEAIKKNDYSAIVANLYYVHSGEKKNGVEEDPGLYRRSLSRMILAARDLTGKEKAEAQNEIDKFYTKAKACFKKNNKSTTDLDNIYSFYKNGHFEVKNNKENSFTIKVDSVFKGKGGWSVARAAYQAQDTNKMSFNEYYEKFNRLNSKAALDNMKVGDTINIPLIDSTKIDSAKLTEAINKNAASAANANNNTEVSDNNEQAAQKSDNSPGLLSKIGRWFSSKFKSLINLFKGGKKSSDKNDDAQVEEKLTPFKQVIKNANNKKDVGELTLFTMDYEVKDESDETVYRIAKEFDTSIDMIKKDNHLDDKYTIHKKQKLSIQKLGYKIKSGDTLTGIAKKFGLTIEILKDMNGIEDINDIKCGQIIEIPGFSHTVQPGDTLSHIAKKVGVSIDHLKAINGLKSDTIIPNQKIIIIFNNSDYAVPDSQKKVTVNKVTKTVTETIDMTSQVKGVEGRELLRTKQRENGIVVATRKVYNPTAKGPLSGKTIIVNAGHGYSEAPNPDVGTESKGRDGVEDEWLCNYDNAMRLKDKLVAQGAKVIFIQGAANTAAAEIKKKRNKADLFISVHVNSFEGKTQDRTQIYYTSSPLRVGTAVNNKSQKLAEIMEKNFDNWIPKNEKISNEDRFPLEGKQDYAQTDKKRLLVCGTAESNHNAPSVLWEVAFMATKKGRLRLKDDTLMKNYANVMSQSVIEYFNKKS